MITSKIIQSTVQLGLIFGLVGIIISLADAFFAGLGIIFVLKICFFLALITFPIFFIRKFLGFSSNSYKYRFVFYMLIFLTTNTLLFAFEQSFHNYFFPDYKAIYAEKKTRKLLEKMEEVEAKNNFKIENKESSLHKQKEEIIKHFGSRELTKKYANTGIIYLLLSLVLSSFNKKSSISAPLFYP